MNTFALVVRRAAADHPDYRARESLNARYVTF